MKLKNLFGIIASTALITVSASACANASATAATDGTSASTAAATANEETKQLRTIRVGHMTGLPNQYADYIGTQQGIYEKYGIKLETSEYAAGINTVDAIATGTADIGLLADFAAVNRIGNTLDATNLVIFTELALSEFNVGGLYVAPKYADDLKSLDGSEGWITQIGTVWEYYNWQSQTYIGIDPDKQKIVQTDSKQTSLALAAQGNASAIIAHGADAKRFEAQGWVLAATSKEIGVKTGTFLVTTREFLEQNNDLVADYLKALNESIDYVTANVESSAESAEAKFGIAKDDFIVTWQSFNFGLGFSEAGAEHLEKVGAWAFEHGRFPKEYDIRKFIDTSAAEKAIPDKVTLKK